MSWWPGILEALERGERCASVSVVRVLGSAPREPGARLRVHPDGSYSGTIGGGALEWEAIQSARALLVQGEHGSRLTHHALGPDLGQCCGGSVTLLTELHTPAQRAAIQALAEAELAGPVVTTAKLEPPARVDRCIVSSGPSGSATLEGDRIWDGQGLLHESFGVRGRPVCLFGAGHVGKALMLALAPLPFRLTWVDSREDIFPRVLPGNVQAVYDAEPARLVAGLPAESLIVVMTHSHPLDLDIVAAALRRDVFPFVGVIGSKSKRARFRSRLRQAGLEEGQVDALTCPLGIGEIDSRLPAAIAVSVAAQLLSVDGAHSRPALQPAPRRVESVL